jgi:hydrogenase nickel incorporation protein HypA/HybF
VHELSIAVSLVEIAREKAAEAGGGRVLGVKLRLGRLSGVVRQSLELAFEQAAAGTPLEGARLEIEEVALAVLCPACREERELPEGQQELCCPACGTPTGELVRGRELQLEWLEVL